MLGKLDIAATDNPQLGNDFQGCRAQFLIFEVGQGLGWCHDNRVSGVDTNRIEVLHAADGDRVAFGVAHGFEFNFLPASNAAFDQNLVYPAGIEARHGKLAQCFFVRCDTATRTTQGESRPDYDRIADLLSQTQAFFEVVGSTGWDARFVDSQHRGTELLAVFAHPDPCCRGTQHGYVVLFQKSGFGQFHRKIQTGLAAEGGQQAVNLLIQHNPLDDIDLQRLQIDFVSHIGVGHDRRRVAVDQDDFVPFSFQGAAGLGPCIIKLGSLADDNRSRADDHDFMNVRAFGHVNLLSGKEPESV